MNRLRNLNIFAKVFVIIVLTIITTSASELLLFRGNNFFSEVKDSKEINEFSYELDNYIRQGYEEEDGGYITVNNDPWFLKENVNRYVKNVKIKCNDPVEEDIPVTIYYSTNGNEFSEQQAVASKITKGSSEKILVIGKNVKSVRIDIGSDVNQKFKLDSIKFNIQDNMLKWYILRLAIMCMLSLTIISFIFFSKEKIKLHNTFVVFGILYGILFTLIMPINQIPDEHSHFTSAYRYSNKMLFIQETGNDNTLYMRKCDSFFNSIGSDSNKELYITELKTLAGTYDTQLVEVQGKKVNNFPLLYLPSAILITIARILRLNPIIMYLMGRLVNLGIFVALGQLALKKMPIGRSALFVIMMMPMVIHQAASYSADSILNSVAFTFIAYCTSILLTEEVKKEDLFIGTILAATLAPSKVTYFPILIIVFLIMIRKYKNTKEQKIVLGLFVFCVLFTFFIQNLSILTGALTEGGDKVNNVSLLYDGTEGYSFSFILKNPLLFIKILFNTFKELGSFYVYTMVGKNLGWLNINVNQILIDSFIVLIIVACFNNKDSQDEKLCLHLYEKIIVFIICISVIGLVEVALFSSWTHYGSMIIEGVQGRYFIPILPMIVLLLRNNKIKINYDMTKAISYGTVVLEFCVITSLFTTIISR